MRRYFAVISSGAVISIKKIKAYNLEFLMMAVHFLFSIAFVFLFWRAILDNFEFPGYWSSGELYFYAAVVLLADGVNEIFFPYRILPYSIVNGDLNKYLIRPISPLLLFFVDNINILAVLEQLVISVIAIVIIVISQGIAVSAPMFLVALLLIICGTISYQLIYAAFSLLSFWFGDIGFLRELVFGVNDLKRYPLDIFAAWLRKVLTFILPISLLAFYPISIMLGKIELGITILAIYAAMLLASVMIFSIMWKMGLMRYEANS